MTRLGDKSFHQFKIIYYSLNRGMNSSYAFTDCPISFSSTIYFWFPSHQSSENPRYFKWMVKWLLLKCQRLVRRFFLANVYVFLLRCINPVKIKSWICSSSLDSSHFFNALNLKLNHFLKIIYPLIIDFIFE